MTEGAGAGVNDKCSHDVSFQDQPVNLVQPVVMSEFENEPQKSSWFPVETVLREHKIEMWTNRLKK